MHKTFKDLGEIAYFALSTYGVAGAAGADINHIVKVGIDSSC